MLPDDGSIVGAIPSSLFTGMKTIHVFSNMYDHMNNILTSVSIATSTNPTYEFYCYDKITNLSLNHEYSCIVLNIGLTVDPESLNVIVFGLINDSSIFESIYSNQMVGNLCASQKYHKMDLFLTFNCNQADCFGLKDIQNWIDSGIWKKFYPNYFNCIHSVKNEINNEIEQSAALLFLGKWTETKTLFIQYLLRSKSIYLKSVGDIFARDEYQKDYGNIPHVHAMISINWYGLIEEQ